MSNVSLDRSVQVPDGIVFRELQGETVILNLESGTYFGLDPIGTRIWQLCQERQSLQLVWDALQDEFDAPAQDLHADLIAFIDELTKHGLVALR